MAEWTQTPVQGDMLRSRNAAERLSQTIPQLLVHLTEEPSLGLHFVCAHAQDRAVPTLVATKASLRDRTTIARDAALDAKYTAESLSAALGPALASMRSLSKLVELARNATTEALADPVPVISAQ